MWLARCKTAFLPFLNAQKSMVWGASCRSISSASDISKSTSQVLPKEAEVVIAGGGAVGCSVAYHLTKLGIKDVVLLEQGRLGCGTTWHAAGLLGSLRSSSVEYHVSRYGIDLYSTLEQETGHATGFKRCGSLNIATTKDRVTSVKRLIDKSRQLGNEVHEVGQADIQRLYPLLKVDDVLFGVWLPNDGVVNPSDVVQSLMKGASRGGARFFESVQVLNVLSEGARVRGVETNLGLVKCDAFVNCAGLWSKELGQKSEPVVDLPYHPCEHFYIVSKPVSGLDRMAPVVRDYDAATYTREFSGGIMGGGFEPVAKPCFYRGTPEKFEFQLLDEDWDHFSYLMKGLLHRYPILDSTEVRQFVNGPESFTPDGKSIVCRSPVFENYFIATGMSSGGIVSSAAAGKIISELVAHGESSLDSHLLDVTRFFPGSHNQFYLREKVTHALGYHYKLSYPKVNPPECREIKHSQLHGLLDGAGAVWGFDSGWEIANYFSADLHDLQDPGFGRPAWLSKVQEEMKVCRDALGVYDLSSESKFLLKGDGSEPLYHVLGDMCSVDVRAMKAGQYRACAFIKKDKKIVATGQLAVLAPDLFFISTSPGQHANVASHLQRTLRSHSRHHAVVLEDVTGKYASMALLGRHKLDLIDELLAPPFNSLAVGPNCFQTVNLGYACDVIMLRGSLSGLDSCQIYVPTEYGYGLYKLLISRGQKYGIRNVGAFAVDSMRVRNMIPAFGSELGPRSCADNSGWAFYHDFDQDFLENIPPVLSTAMVLLKVNVTDKDNWPWGGEPVVAGDASIGNVTSIGYGVDGDDVVALTLLGTKFLQRGLELKVRVAGCLYDATVIGEYHRKV